VDQIDIEGIEEVNEAYGKLFKLYEEYTKDKAYVRHDIPFMDEYSSGTNSILGN